MKIIKSVTGMGIVSAFFMVCLYGSQPSWSAENENHCFSCHTNARKLIEITRQIAKVNKSAPGGSAETKGEG